MATPPAAAPSSARPSPGSSPAAPPKKRVSAATAWRETKALIAEHRGRLLFGLALMLVNRLVGLVLPASSRFLVDDVLGKQRLDLLLPLALASGAATLVQAASGYSLSQVLGVAAQKAINDMRKEVQAHVGRLPVAAYDSTQTGVLIARIMNDAEGLRNLVGTGIVQLAGGIVSAALGIGVLFWLHWRMTLLILAALALFGGGMAWAFKVLRPLFRERGKLMADATGRLNQTLAGVRVVKAYVAEEAEERVFSANVDRLFENVRRSMTGVSLTGSFATAIVGIVGAILTYVGGRAIAAGTMTLGDFVMYLAFLGIVVGPVVNIASIGTQISEAFAGLDRIRELRRQATEDARDGELSPWGEGEAAIRGEVAFERVSFEYDAGKPVLKEVSFVARAGTTTALVGSSGSGKSTIASLVLAFHRPTAGRVAVDGRDLATIRLRDWRRRLGVVLQDNFLFDGTIAQNVAFSRPDAPREAIEAACRAARCDEFAARFEKGLDTVVGERGVKLSGGQRQRVAIARALLADPRVLILDEATSSLDSESEALIQEALVRLRRDRTTFVIAHRLSTIRSADQILVVEGGEIVERGTHAQLIAQGGRYRQLHDRQHAVEEERFVNPGEELRAE